MKQYVLAIALLLLAHSGSPLVNGTPPEEDDTRFDAIAAFSKTDWLTITKNNKHKHNWIGGAVLIAPDVVLFARHLISPRNRNAPANTFMVRFRRHADGSLGSRAEGPDSYHQVPIAKIILATRSDLAFGILAKPVEHIQPVKIHLENGPIKDQVCMLAGWGSESPWRNKLGPRTGLHVGQNKVSTSGNLVRILSYKTETRNNEQGKPAAYIVDENAVPNMFDSGGSIFLLDKDDNVKLVGLISTYTGGPHLATANTDDFPIEAATQGGRALIDSLKAHTDKRRGAE